MAKRRDAESRAKALSLVGRFAELLDRDRFAAARRMMAPGCRYRFRGKTVVGADKIVGMYRASAAKGRRYLDEVRLESKIEGIRAGTVGILYTDRLRKGRHAHVHRCRQFVKVLNGKVVAIRHSDMRGRENALHAFFKAAGVVWK